MISPLYLLDTNICIYLMRHQTPQVSRHFSSCRVGEVLISAITAAELEFGILTSGADADQNRRALDRFVAEVPVAPFAEDAARCYARVRLASRERRRDALDKLIAAHAIALGVTLVTNNPRDFSIYPDLRITNWADET